MWKKDYKMDMQDFQEIEEYIEKLKLEEKYNRQFFWKEKKDSDPFFNNFFNRKEEKDW